MDFKIKTKPVKYTITAIVLEGNNWKFQTECNMVVEIPKNSLLKVGDIFYQVHYQHEDGSWSYSYCDAWNSFSRKIRDENLTKKYAKCKNPVSRWWFKFWHEVVENTDPNNPNNWKRK